MADSSTTDLNKMKVIDLRRELKSRGLPCAGDKASLIARLQQAISQETPYMYIDSDDLDSDGVLDEDDKSHSDLPHDIGVESSNEELVLEDQPPLKPVVKSDTDRTDEKLTKRKTLKRNLSVDLKLNSSKLPLVSDVKINKELKGTTEAAHEITAKKIVLKRATSLETPLAVAKDAKIDEDKASIIKVNPNLDTKTRLELRAKRFGLPVKMSDDERKEARKLRFDNKAASKPNTQANVPMSANQEILKKRAERFGMSVSKFMTDIENKEKLEKRKIKFGSVK